MNRNKRPPRIRLQDKADWRELHAILQRIEEKVDRIMAQQDDLAALLTDIANDANAAASGHAELLSELQTLQAQAAQNQPVDLSGAIAQAQAIKSTLDGIVQATAAAPTADASATPPSEPAAPTSTTPAS